MTTSDWLRIPRPSGILSPWLQTYRRSSALEPGTPHQSRSLWNAVLLQVPVLSAMNTAFCVPRLCLPRLTQPCPHTFLNLEQTSCLWIKMELRDIITKCNECVVLVWILAQMDQLQKTFWWQLGRSEYGLGTMWYEELLFILLGIIIV